jgi:hypothetical protein
MSSPLLRNLLHFSRLLGSLGLDVQASCTLDVVQALRHIDIGRRTDFYHTLRCLLVSRPRDIPIFDQAFRTFWRRPPSKWTDRDLHAMGEQRKTGPPQMEAPALSDESRETASPPLTIDQGAVMSYSKRDVLRTRDFAQFTEGEIAEAQEMMAELTWDVDTRRTRRWQPGHGPVPDLRRVVRANARYGYEWLELPTRRRKERRRPLALLCDVSGSMERYTRMLLHFLFCMRDRLRRVEVFVFATRLTCVTRELNDRLGRRMASAAISSLTDKVPDFSGGTRIGDALSTFNRRWSRRVLGHGSVLLIISDGWDRGDPDQLGREMARLHRTAHRVIWLNPLLGSPEYSPQTRGMRAAMPHIDDFLPVHNLESLAQLGQHLNELDAIGPLHRML